MRACLAGPDAFLGEADERLGILAVRSGDPRLHEEDPHDLAQHLWREAVLAQPHRVSSAGVGPHRLGVPLEGSDPALREVPRHHLASDPRLADALDARVDCIKL